MISCRFNPNHKMKPNRLIPHEEKCPDRKNKVLKICPYNPLHRVGQENLDKHKRTCPDKPKVDKELEEDLMLYLSTMNKLSFQTPLKTPSNITQVSISNDGVIEDKKNKKEQQKKVLKMMDGWDNGDDISECSQSKFNFSPSEVNDNQTQFNDLDSIFERDNDLYEASVIRRNKNQVDFEQEDEDIFGHIYY